SPAAGVRANVPELRSRPPPTAHRPLTPSAIRKTPPHLRPPQSPQPRRQQHVTPPSPAANRRGLAARVGDFLQNRGRGGPGCWAVSPLREGCGSRRGWFALFPAFSFPPRTQQYEQI